MQQVDRVLYHTTNHTMQFQREELIEREIEIAGYLLKNLLLKQISGKTQLNKKHLQAHLRNMMEKLGAENILVLKQILLKSIAGKVQSRITDY